MCAVLEENIKPFLNFVWWFHTLQEPRHQSNDSRVKREYSRHEKKPFAITRLKWLFSALVSYKFWRSSNPMGYTKESLLDIFFLYLSRIVFMFPVQKANSYLKHNNIYFRSVPLYIFIHLTVIKHIFSKIADHSTPKVIRSWMICTSWSMRHISLTHHLPQNILQQILIMWLWIT